MEEGKQKTMKVLDAQLCKEEDCRREYMEGIVKFDGRKQQGNAEYIVMGGAEGSSDSKC